jgi:hypothetical protein
MTAGPAVRHILEAYYGVEQSEQDPHPTGTRPIGATPEKSDTGAKAKKNPRARAR